MFIALFIRQVMNASSPLTFLTFTGSPGLLQRPVWRRRHGQEESPWTGGHWGHDSGQGSYHTLITSQLKGTFHYERFVL